MNQSHSNDPDVPTLFSVAKKLYQGMVITIVVFKFTEIVTGKRLTP